MQSWIDCLSAVAGAISGIYVKSVKYIYNLFKHIAYKKNTKSSCNCAKYDYTLFMIRQEITQKIKWHKDILC